MTHARSPPLPPFNPSASLSSATSSHQPTDHISPISSTFPHKTSPAVMTQTPLIDTNTRAINDAPVELDSGAAVGVEERVKRRDSEASVRGYMRSPDEGIEAEFLAEGEGGGVGKLAREKRAAMLASRAKDPGVIVNVPQEPTAEEVEAARKADALVVRGAAR